MKKIAIPAFVLILSIGFLSCNQDPDSPEPGSNVVNITSDITSHTTWSGDSIYIIRAWDFYVSASLTIEPGAIIKFHPTEGPVLTLGSGGTIIANGTTDLPIIFTSFKDDAHGGDQNGDGSVTSPARRDWGEINTNGEMGSEFSYCEFWYGGASSYSSTLSLQAGSRATVDHCAFIQNDGSDGTGWYGALDASGAGSGTVITNNTFYGNIRPLSTNTLFSLDNSNVFHDPDNPSTTNDLNGIFVETLNEVTSAISWSETEVAFVIDDNDFWIESGGSLSLANDVVLKMRSGSGLVLGGGTSSIPNYNGSGVVFTSFKDDSHKGDTNGDGSVTSPGIGDWVGIFDNTLTIPSPYFYNWSNIYYDEY